MPFQELSADVDPQRPPNEHDLDPYGLLTDEERNELTSITWNIRPLGITPIDMRPWERPVIVTPYRVRDGAHRAAQIAASVEEAAAQTRRLNEAREFFTQRMPSRTHLLLRQQGVPNRLPDFWRLPAGRYAALDHSDDRMISSVIEIRESADGLDRWLRIERRPDNNMVADGRWQPVNTERLIQNRTNTISRREFAVVNDLNRVDNFAGSYDFVFILNNPHWAAQAYGRIFGRDPISNYPLRSATSQQRGMSPATWSTFVPLRQETRIPASTGTDGGLEIWSRRNMRIVFDPSSGWQVYARAIECWVVVVQGLPSYHHADAILRWLRTHHDIPHRDEHYSWDNVYLLLQQAAYRHLQEIYNETGCIMPENIAP